jgi:hypothetical protein
METITECVPTETLMLMGVTLPVSTPSTKTLAPDGNEVTFNAPFCAPALLGTSKSAPINTIKQTILLGCVIESSLNALFAVNFEQTWRGSGLLRGNATIATHCQFQTEKITARRHSPSMRSLEIDGTSRRREVRKSSNCGRSGLRFLDSFQNYM